MPSLKEGVIFNDVRKMIAVGQLLNLLKSLLLINAICHDGIDNNANSPLN